MGLSGRTTCVADGAESPGKSGSAASKKLAAGVFLGDLLSLPRAVVPCGRAVLLSPQQAAAAVARGVAVAYADVVQ